MTAHRRPRALAATLALLLCASTPILNLPQADAAFAATTSIATNKWTGGTAWCTNAGQKLGNPGFETGTASPWTVTLPTEISNSVTFTPHTGQWYAWLAPTAVAPQFVSQTVTLPTGCSTATLSFYLHIEFHGGQGSGTLAVQLLNSAGTLLTTLATLSTNNASGYVQYSYNLNAYAGQTITVKFNATATGLRLPNFVIDDTNLSVS